MIETDVIDEGWPPGINWDDLVLRAAGVAISATHYAALTTCAATIEIAVRLTTDAEVQILNREYREKDKPTNVLSFPMIEPDEMSALPGLQPELLLGDLALAQETCAREAEEKGVTLEAHATHLVVHGVLHLLGYDHMGQEEAEAMEAIEQQVMASLGLHDPYGD